ncbi:MAG: T3SS effector HopA1 family protein [Nostoc sp.]|uniref:T3SS effector HopA1 family protein n=1 Tax=Nostoc sp. TaxID=1180 RepID=UPI002FFD34D5
MQVLEKLQDIATHLQIKYSDLFVCHSDYQLPKTSADVIAQLQKLPQKMQFEYLNSLLRNSILSIYYNGSLLLEKTQAIKADYGIELDNTASEVDWEFCEKLQNNNQGKGWWNQNFRVLREEADGSLAVQKKDVIVHIQRSCHLRVEEQLAAVGDWVSVYTPSGQVIDQFYMAYGNFVSTFDDSTVFIYFNFSPEGAVAVMKELTIRLNKIEIPFIFHVLHNPSHYGRYDSAFLRINKERYTVVRQVIQSIYTQNQSHFQNQVPIFTKVLAPGLGLAEKPEQEFLFPEGFGLNRCQIVANALLEAHKNGDESKEARMKYILKHFENLGINLERPYLNPNSEDIYTPLY